MAVAFHGQPSNNIDNVFSANSNYRVHSISMTHVVWRSKNFKVCIIYFDLFRLFIKCPNTKDEIRSFQVLENKESDRDAVKRIL